MGTTTAGYQIQVGELLRELREKRRLSVRTLAARAGFSPSFISQVENGQASPSIASLERIATALDVTLVEFFQLGDTRSPAVVRAEQRPRLESKWSKAEIESLGLDRTARLEPVLIQLRAGGTSGTRPHSLAREQFAFVVSGELTLLLDGTQQVLARGDAITIPPQKLFRWVNASRAPAELLIVSSRAL
jgi:XRE family transcriptional regulator, regulator of sulfur utilization